MKTGRMASRIRSASPSRGEGGALNPDDCRAAREPLRNVPPGISVTAGPEASWGLTPSLALEPVIPIGTMCFMLIRTAVWPVIKLHGLITLGGCESLKAGADDPFS